MAIYRDPILGAIINLFNSYGPPELKNRYFYGDPLQVPKSQLPAVFLTKDITEISNLTNAEDQSAIHIVANIVLDLTRDFNQAFDNVTSSNAVYDFMEGRDAAYELKPTSLCYILRKYQSLGNNVWINPEEPLRPDYGIGVEKRGPGIFTVEGVIRFMVLHKQITPGM